MRRNKVIYYHEDRIKNISSNSPVFQFIEGIVRSPKEIDNLPSPITNKLLALGFLEKQRKGLFYTNDSKFDGSEIDIKLSNQDINKDKIIEIISTLQNLFALDGYENNKSHGWVNDIRKELFSKHGTTPLKLKEIFLGESIFHKHASEMLNKSQSQINSMRIFLMDLIFECLEKNEEEIDLNDEDLKEINKIMPKPPTNLIQDYNAIIKLFNIGDYKAQLQYLRSSYLGLRINSRFIKEIPQNKSQEVYKNFKHTIFADLIGPGKRDKAILLRRPKSTEYVISVDNQEVREDQIKIDLDDLYIYCSSNEIVLFSKSLNKRIIPVLTSSYLSENDDHSLYRFLSALAKINFNQGIHLDLFWMNRHFYPQISYKGIILFPKTWIYSKEILLDKIKNKSISLPKYLRIIDGDRQFFCRFIFSYFY